MAERNVKICDVCKKRTADKICILCKNDLCNSCGRHSFDLVVRSKDKVYVIGEIVFCKECKNKITKDEELFDENFANEMSQKIGGYLVKKKLVESL